VLRRQMLYPTELRARSMYLAHYMDFSSGVESAFASLFIAGPLFLFFIKRTNSQTKPK
jgi:hypothetical protein